MAMKDGEIEQSTTVSHTATAPMGGGCCCLCWNAARELLSLECEIQNQEGS